MDGGTCGGGVDSGEPASGRRQSEAPGAASANARAEPGGCRDDTYLSRHKPAPRELIDTGAIGRTTLHAPEATPRTHPQTRSVGDALPGLGCKPNSWDLRLAHREKPVPALPLKDVVELRRS